MREYPRPRPLAPEIRVPPLSFDWITECSEHEAHGGKAQEGERLTIASGEKSDV